MAFVVMYGVVCGIFAACFVVEAYNDWKQWH